jgi:hypothetical protein
MCAKSHVLLRSCFKPPVRARTHAHTTSRASALATLLVVIPFQSFRVGDANFSCRPLFLNNLLRAHQQYNHACLHDCSTKPCSHLIARTLECGSGQLHTRGAAKRHALFHCTTLLRHLPEDNSTTVRGSRMASQMDALFGDRPERHCGDAAQVRLNRCWVWYNTAWLTGGCAPMTSPLDSMRWA